MKITSELAERIIQENPKFVSLEDDRREPVATALVVLDRMRTEASDCLDDPRPDYKQHACMLLERIDAYLGTATLPGLKKRGVAVTTKVVRDIMDRDGI